MHRYYPTIAISLAILLVVGAIILAIVEAKHCQDQGGFVMGMATVNQRCIGATSPDASQPR